MKTKEIDHDKAMDSLKKANRAYKDAYAEYRKDSKGGKTPSAKVQLATKTKLDELVEAFTETLKSHGPAEKKKGATA